MKQCPDCETHKKADNCITCAVKWRKQANNLLKCVVELKRQIEDISKVLNEPLKDYQKLKKIVEIIEGRLIPDIDNTVFTACDILDEDFLNALDYHYQKNKIGEIKDKSNIRLFLGEDYMKKIPIQITQYRGIKIIRDFRGLGFMFDVNMSLNEERRKEC